ncbi:MAG: glycosyltransferase family 4 protein [Capsulimonadales bacterium]|nr:glycosyltransferase family 4 protein [Capsulimonadales bacterium]
MTNPITDIRETPKRRFAILSSCPEAWGGSEELWGGTALRLAKAGHEVHVFKTLVDDRHPSVNALREAGVVVWDHYRLPVPRRNYYVRRLPGRWKNGRLAPHIEWIMAYIRGLRPDLMVVSQGENFDGLEYTELCRRVGFPYVIICQKASDLNWPTDQSRDQMRHAYRDSVRNYFVSRHNRELTEMQIGTGLENAEVVANPCMTTARAPLPWPESDSEVVRGACVGRLFALEKGQDILLRVLARPKWQERPLEISFFGKGIHSAALREAAEYLGLKNVRFAGFTTNVTDVWRTHHFLVLPSRAEGLPLSVIEAMVCGRPAIVTRVGGNADVIEDGVTGFLSSGIDPDGLDETMERAWACRHRWERIGCAAANSVRSWLPEDPCSDFKEKLLKIAAGSHK